MDSSGVIRQDAAAGPPFGMVIVSEIRFLRESLVEVFRAEPVCEVRGACGELEAAIAMCALHTPDIVLLDAAFPPGTAAVAALHAASPASCVVALALVETEETVIAWAEAGAAGYVPNTAALADLTSMLIGIARGAQTCSAHVASGLLRRIAQGSIGRQERPHETPAIPTLTARERQIVDLIGAGMCNKDIARQLNIGLATTKTHVHNLLSKLNIQRRGQAAAWLRRYGTP